MDRAGCRKTNRKKGRGYIAERSIKRSEGQLIYVIVIAVCYPLTFTQGLLINGNPTL